MDFGSGLESVEVQRQLYIYYYINAAAFTLLFYDYILTLPAEIARYWPRTSTGDSRVRVRLSSPTILFFANRYGTLLGNIPVVVLSTWTTEPSARKEGVCSALSGYHQYFIIGIQIIVGVMLILRTYALYERNKYVLGFMVAVSVGVIAVGIWGTLRSNALPPEDKGRAMPLRVGCTYGITHRESFGLMIAWSAMGLFDVMIFALTLYRTLVYSRRHGRWMQRRARGSGSALDLTVVLMQDGTVYFGAMVLCNVGNILTFVLGGDFTRGILNTFTNIVSSVLINRLMLNLRAGLGDSDGGTRMPTRTTAEESDWVSTGTGVFSSYWDADAGDNINGRVRGRDVELQADDGPRM
ncbi:hypothetical protein MKEN_00963000 [Mycena kentingensis (nom. inval.)]|nr:hypothetical protein MKEN_00963000 [Mycena kentingensis (nom. inval.)]